MYLPPAEILNKVIRTTVLKTITGMQLFAMNQDQLDQEMNSQHKALMEAGVDGLVGSAYQALGPLLLEREAIGRFMRRTENYSLRGVLLELTSPEEAVDVATQDLMLQPEQQKQLLAMFQELM